MTSLDHSLTGRIQVTQQTINRTLFVQGREHLRVDLHKHLRTGRAAERPRGQRFNAKEKTLYVMLVHLPPGHRAENIRDGKNHATYLRDSHCVADWLMGRCGWAGVGGVL